MADLLKELQDKNAALEAKALKLAEENESLRTAAPVEADANAVPGVLKLTTTVKGESLTKTYSIAPGHKRMWTAAGNQVPTENVVKIANGEKPSADDLASYPHLAEFVDAAGKDNGEAKRLFTEMAQRGASILVEKTK
jgi:hypothetical protein